MNRRNLLKGLGKLALLASPFTGKLVRAFALEPKGALGAPFVLIYDSLAFSDASDRLIQKADVYLRTRDSQWRRKLVVLDIRTHGEDVQAFLQKYGANTKNPSYPVLVGVPQDVMDSAGEVAIWDSAWLRMADQEGAVCYPVSDNWWSVEGDWHPSIEKVRKHLFKSPNHKDGHFQNDWLETLIFEELQSLHSDHHREMSHQGMVQWQLVNISCRG